MLFEDKSPGEQSVYKKNSRMGFICFPLKSMISIKLLIIISVLCKEGNRFIESLNQDIMGVLVKIIIKKNNDNIYIYIYIYIYI